MLPELHALLAGFCETGDPLEKLLLLADMQGYYTPLTKKTAEHIAELQKLLVLLSKINPEELKAG